MWFLVENPEEIKQESHHDPKDNSRDSFCTRTGADGTNQFKNEMVDSHTPRSK
jgi:hypothetical protein